MINDIYRNIMASGKHKNKIRDIQSMVRGSMMALTGGVGTSSKPKKVDVEKAITKLQARVRGRQARTEAGVKSSLDSMIEDVVADIKEEQLDEMIKRIQSGIRGKQYRDEHKYEDTQTFDYTTLGKKGDVPRTVLIKVDDFLANYVIKDEPIKFEEMIGSDALKVAQNRDKPIGVKKFANFYKYVDKYWDTKAPGEKFTFYERLHRNNMNFNSKDVFLNTFNINTRIETKDAIKARESKKPTTATAKPKTTSKPIKK